jgi:hypothetical protein
MSFAVFSSGANFHSAHSPKALNFIKRIRRWVFIYLLQETTVQHTRKHYICMRDKGSLCEYTIQTGLYRNYYNCNNGPLEKFTAQVLYRSVFYLFIAPSQAI